MPNFEVINDSSKITLSGWWGPPYKFNSKNILVNIKGNQISSSFEGHRYRIIGKKERSFSILERVIRCLVGLLLVIGTLGIALFSKSVRNLCTKSKANIRFGILESSEFDSIRKVKPLTDPLLASKTSDETQNTSTKKEIVISSEITNKIQTCMRGLQTRNKVDGLNFYNSQDSHLIFSLDIASDLIFKMQSSTCCNFGGANSMNDRYQKIVQAQIVVKEQNLNLLVIPSAKLFTVAVENRTYEILAEEKLDINPYESRQEQYFRTCARSLDGAIKQLAEFICKTGYSDVDWRNIPILNNSLDQNGNRQIALVDIEDMNGAETGLFGGDWDIRGLVRCVNQAQGTLVQVIAQNNGISLELFEKAVENRTAELEESRRLDSYYATKKIVVGDELVTLDESDFDFPEYPEQSKILKKFTNTLLKEINYQISRESSEQSIKGRRYVYISSNQFEFNRMRNELIDTSLDTKSLSSEEHDKSTFLGYVLQKFEELEVIYKAYNKGSRAFIQA